MSIAPRPVISDISLHVREGRLGKAYWAFYYLGPLYTTLATTGCMGALYFKFFVPWRHIRTAYSSEQMVWRKAMGSTGPANPMLKKTFYTALVLSIYLDKFRRDAYP